MLQKRRFASLLVICALIGVLVRAWLMWRSGWRIEYDEAMLGLMAVGILRGETPIFLAAQPTLGAGEAYYLAGLFAVFGTSAVTLRVMSLTCAAGYILGVGVLGRLAFNHRTGILAALLAAISPLYLIAVGTKVWAGTMGTLTLGTWLLVLVALALQSNVGFRVRLRWFALVGFIAGLLLWTAFLSAYYLIPAALVMVWWLVLGSDLIHQPPTKISSIEDSPTTLPNKLLLIITAGVLFFAGSAPFWWGNLTGDWVTFRMAFSGESSTLPEIRAVANHLYTDLIPRLASGSPEWGGLGATARVFAGWLYIGGLIGLLALTVSRSRQPGAVPRYLAAGVVLSVPLIYLASGYARNALNPYGVDATGRYVLMWHTVFPVGVAAVAVWLGERRRWFLRLTGAGFAALVLTLNLIGMARVNPVRLFDSPYYDRLPADLTPLIDYLDSQDIRYVWTDVGIAHPLIFATKERILAADYWDVEIAGGLVRFPAYLAAVTGATERGETVAYVEAVQIDQNTPPIEQALNAASVSYTAERVGELVIYIPDNPVAPADIAAGLGYQY
jgi:hypothetical protein